MSKTADNSSYAYVNLNLAEREIENVFDTLKQLPHVRYLNINTNKLRSLDGVSEMHSLLALDCSQNEIKSSLFLSQKHKLTFLQTINLSQNKIKTIDALELPRLRKLNLNDNLINSLEGLKNHRSLESLSLRRNKLRDMKGCEGWTSLKLLDLKENQIKSWEGLQRLPSLEVLQLRNNQIKTIPEDLPEFPRLKRVNLRENKLPKQGEIKKLLKYKTLDDLSVAGNPFEEELGGDARKELIILLCLEKKGTNISVARYLPKLNKEAITEDELKEITEEWRGRLEEELQRKREEEEARREEEEQKRLAEEEARREAYEQRKLEEEARRQEEEERRLVEEQAREEERLRLEEEGKKERDEEAGEAGGNDEKNEEDGDED